MPGVDLHLTADSGPQTIDYTATILRTSEDLSTTLLMHQQEPALCPSLWSIATLGLGSSHPHV